jgi:hypothetical protein
MKLIRFYIKLGQVPNPNKPSISNPTNLPELPRGYTWRFDGRYYRVVGPDGKIVESIPPIDTAPQSTSPSAVRPSYPSVYPHKAPFPTAPTIPFKPAPGFSGIPNKPNITDSSRPALLPRPPVHIGPPQFTDPNSRIRSVPAPPPDPREQPRPDLLIDPGRFDLKIEQPPPGGKPPLDYWVEWRLLVMNPYNAGIYIDEHIQHLLELLKHPFFENFHPRQKDPRTGAIRIGELLWNRYDASEKKYYPIHIGMFTAWTMLTKDSLNKFGPNPVKENHQLGPFGVDFFIDHIITPWADTAKKLQMPVFSVSEWPPDELVADQRLVLDRRALREINFSAGTAAALLTGGGNVDGITSEQAMERRRKGDFVLSRPRVIVTFGKANFHWDYATEERETELGQKFFDWDPDGPGFIYIAEIPSRMLSFSLVPAVAMQILATKGAIAPEDINPFLTTQLQLEDGTTIHVAAPLHRDYNTNVGYRRALFARMQREGLADQYNNVGQYYNLVTLALVRKYLHYREKVFDLHYKGKEPLPFYYSMIGPPEADFPLLEQALINMANEYKFLPNADKDPNWDKVKLVVPMFVPGANRFLPVVVSAKEFFENMEKDIGKDPGLAWFYLVVLAKNAYMYGYVSGGPSRDPLLMNRQWNEQLERR